MTPNTEQQALISASAPLIVAIAGPGSGKSFALVQRYLAHPGKAIVVTFTNAAAAEVSERIRDAGGEAPWHIGTLHGLCLRIISETRERPLTVLDEATADAVLKQCAADVECSASIKALRAALSMEPPPRTCRVAVARYRRELAMNGAADYDTLLTDALAIIKAGQGPQVDYLYIDEAQDSGTVDAEIYEALAARVKWYCGDIDQSIYGFRGGSPRHLMELTRAPDAYVGTMESNYRSGATICAAAQSLISHNRERVVKRTVSATGTAGAVTVSRYDSETEEISGVLHSISFKAGTVAILCRLNSDVNLFRDALRAAGHVEQQSESTPRDWQFAALTVALWGDPENQLLARQWARIKHGPNADEMIADAARRRQPLLLLPDNLAMAMDAAHLSVVSRLKIIDAAASVRAGLPRRGDSAAILLAAREALSGPARGTGRIQAMTIHKAKGKEFDHVFLPAFEQEIFGTGDVEEMRRLAYVGITRARHSLHISHASHRRSAYTSRMEPRRPSQFITEAGLQP